MKPVKAWAYRTPTGGYVSNSRWTKEAAEYYAGFAKVVRVEIREIKRGKK